MKKWNYKGEIFELPEDLSAQDATARIKEILSERENTSENTSDNTSESKPLPPYVPEKADERGLLGDIGVNLARGVYEGAKATSELVGLYYDVKYNTSGTSLFPKEDNELPTEDPFPIAGAIVKGFEDVGEGVEKVTGIEGKATTLAGEISHVVGQYVAPGGLGAKVVSNVTRLGRLEKLTRARRGKSSLTRRQKLLLSGQQAVGATAVDFIVSSDESEGIHDFFELGPDMSPERKVGETALELLGAKLLNRTLLGAEAGIATVVLPPVLGAALKGTFKFGASRPVEIASDILQNKLGVVTPIARSSPNSILDRARRTTVADLVTVGALPAVRKSLEIATNQILKQEARILDASDKVGLTSTIIANLFANLRYRGFLDPAAARANSLVNAAVEGDVKRADRQLTKVEQKIDEFLARPEMRQQTAVTKQTLMNAFMDVLETGKRPDDIPDELFNAYKSARNIIDQLSNRLLETGAVRALPETAAPGKASRESLMKAIRENTELGGYLRQRYAAYENPKYNIAAGSAREKEIFELIRTSVGGRSENTVFNHIKSVLGEESDFLRITDEQTLDTLTERQMREYIRLVLAKTPAGMGKRGWGGFMGKVPIRKLNTQLLNRRKVESPVLKEILGQVRNPRESYISTVSDLSTFIATDSFYSIIRRVADADMLDAQFRRGKYGEDFLNPAEREALAEARKTNPTATADVLGPKLDGRYIDVPARVAQRQERLQLQLESEVAQGAGDGRVRQLQAEIDGAEEFVMTDLRTKGYHIIGRTDSSGNIIKKDPGQSESAFGSLHNIAMPEAMASSLQRNIISDDNFLGNILRTMYGGMLKLKGISQFNKTILSPITQVRNVTSASMFALAQGNVGSGASLGQSVDIVLRDLINKKFLSADYRLTDEGVEYLADLQQRGIIGSSAELRELQDNLRKATNTRSQNVMEDHALVSDVATTGPKDSGLGGSLDRMNRRNLMWQFLGKTADAYRAGDDVWKIYNYEFEQAKLREAYTKMLERLANSRRKNPMDDQQFQKVVDAQTRRFKQFLGDENAVSIEEAIKTRAADNVRNLVPNYELVPQLVKDIRGLPVGNFIAFPTEIIRTGFNTLETSMKELASDDAGIREIGMRRLMGSLGTFYVAGPALRDTAMNLVGVTPEEMEAVNITAAPYQRDSTFIPLGRNEKGYLEVLDFSHFNPYDMLIRPFEAALNSLDESNKLQRGAFNTVYQAGHAALAQLTEPFLSESIAFAVARDVLPESMYGRGGVTQTGAKVYRDAETFGKKMERSLIHALNQMGPSNLDPFRVPVGADVSEIELSRLPRSLLGGRPEFGISETEPSTGRKYAPEGELFRLFTGLSAQEVDPERVLKFKANEFKSERSDAATLFNDVVNRDYAGENDYINGYLAANQARLGAFRRMAVQIRALENLGLSTRDIKRILRKERVGKDEMKALLRGEFLPYSPADAKLDEAKDKNHDIPKSLLRIMERDLRRLSIDPDDPEKPPSDAFDSDRFVSSKETPIPKAIKTSDSGARSTDAAPVPQPTPTPPPVQTGSAANLISPVSVEDLLQDPRDLQIARRRKAVG